MENIELQTYSSDEILIEVPLVEPFAKQTRIVPSSDLLKNIVVWSVFCTCLAAVYVLVILGLVYLV